MSPSPSAQPPAKASFSPLGWVVCMGWGGPAAPGGDGAQPGWGPEADACGRLHVTNLLGRDSSFSGSLVRGDDGVPSYTGLLGRLPGRVLCTPAPTPGPGSLCPPCLFWRHTC